MKYSKIIRPTQTDFLRDAKLRSNLNKFRGFNLDKAVHLYRMWFHLVRLVHELETEKIKFGVDNKLSVKLNKKASSLLTPSFNKGAVESARDWINEPFSS